MTDAEARVVEGKRKRPPKEHGLQAARIDWRYLSPDYLSLLPKDNFKVDREQLKAFDSDGLISDGARQAFVIFLEKYFRLTSTVLCIEQIDFDVEFPEIESKGQMRNDDGKYTYRLNKSLANSILLSFEAKLRGLPASEKLQKWHAKFAAEIVGNIGHELFHLRQFEFDSNSDYLKNNDGVSGLLDILNIFIASNEAGKEGYEILKNHVVDEMYEKDKGEIAARVFQLMFMSKLRKSLLQMKNMPYFDELVLLGVQACIEEQLMWLLEKRGKEDVYDKTLQRLLS